MSIRLVYMALVLVGSLSVEGWADAAYEAVQQGNRLYEDGQYEAAMQQYEAAAERVPDSPEVPFNQGNAFYKQQAYEKAQQHYLRALQTTSPRLESRTKYNLGNVKYQQALQAIAKVPQAPAPALGNDLLPG